MSDYYGINIDYERNVRLKEDSLKLLKDFYLLENEDPQEGFARAALAFSKYHDVLDLELAQRIYDYVSKGWFMFASPILSNAPEPNKISKSMPISCFLTFVDDSLNSLIDHTVELRWLSVMGGGVGGHWSAVRSISNIAPGPIPFLQTVDADMTAYRQGKTRKGSYAAYMDISHPDIVEFINIRVPTGDSNRKCLNIHNAVNITDDFMNAVETDSMWNLIDPKDKSVRDIISARKLWEMLIDTRFRTGEPYFHFIDSSNRGMKKYQKDMGLKVRGSNLCFTGNTKVAVADGRDSVTIEQLAKESNGIIKFPVYSARKNILTGSFNKKTVAGKKWIAEIKNAVAFKTGTKEIIKVILDDGSYFECTPDHLLALYNGDYVEAKNSIGCKLERFHAEKGGKKYRMINNNTSKQHIMIWEFYNNKKRPGGYHIDHIINEENDNINNLQLLDKKESIVKTAIEMSGDNNPSRRFNCKNLPRKIYRAFLQNNSNFSGWSDEDLIKIGRKIYLENGDFSWKIYKKYVKDNGLNCPLTFSKNRFQGNMKNYIDIVLGNKEYVAPEEPYNNFSKEKFINKFDKKYMEVVDVIYTGKVEDVYDLTVEDNHNFYIITNDETRYGSSGVLVHNCSEITLATNNDRTAVCCLSSVNLEFYDEWKSSTMIEDLIVFLDNVLEYFIETAPDTLKKAKYSAMRERSIGLGAMGWHSYLQKNMIAFNSEKAYLKNKEIFSYIYHNALRSNARLARIRGECPDAIENGYYGWRLTNMLAIAPNASSSTICGTSASIEPEMANGYVHRSRIGSYFIKNKFLEELLEKIGMNTDDIWTSIVTNNGSVQHLDFLNEQEKEVFKTFVELDQLDIIKQAADRQIWIDQAQSLNLRFSPDVSKSYVNKVHYMAWKLGLKTLYYLRTETGSKAENVSKKIERVALKEEKSSENECLSCQG